MNDRRVWPWLRAAFMDWQWISVAMTLSLYAVTHTENWALRIVSFVLGMWVVGVFAHRLALLGHDAGHRTITRKNWLNDALAVFFVFWPLLFSIRAWAVYHNEGHHPRQHTGTLRDPEIVFKRIDGSWTLPLSRGRMVRDILLSMFGAMIPGAIIFIISLSTPNCHARVSQVLMWVLKKTKGEQADIMPLRYRNLKNTPLAIAGDLAMGLIQVLGRLAATAAFTIAVTTLMGFPHWELVLLMWYGGYATTFWTVFRLRGYCEHVGGYTISLREPSLLMRMVVFPHGAWAHQLHHEFPGLPFHRYTTVLRERKTQGLGVGEVFKLFETSPPLVSGEFMTPDDPRSVMQRGIAQSLLSPSVKA